jgi:hypothetical protein
LFQFSGDIRRNPRSRRGEVGLEFIRRIPPRFVGIETWAPEEILDPKVPCTICGEEHLQIGVAYRRPCGVWGHWVVFRYLGAEHVPDLSVPIDVPEWPRGIVVLDPEANSKAWHRS